MKSIFLVLLLLLGTAAAYAQEWVSGLDGDATYNCDVLKALNREFGDQVYVRMGGSEYTVAEYHELTVPNCEPRVETTDDTESLDFSVIVQDVVNLRECASTSCLRVGIAQSGDILEVVGEDGDWLEVKYDSATVFIAGWLTTPVVDAPAGLLADFQFRALSPAGDEWALLYGTTGRTGTHWLELAREDGSKSVIELQALIWQSEDASDWFQRPRFFGWGEHDWQLLTQLLPDSSFYVYLPQVAQVFEFPVSSSEYADGFGIGFELGARPANIRAGTPMRIIVAASEQSEHVKNWASVAVNSEVFRPADRLQPPTLVAGDQQVTISIETPATTDAPILAYEIRYHEQGSGTQPRYAFSNSAETFVLENLKSGKTYRFAVAGISRGGKGAYSNAATVTLSE